jgi:Plasmid pRiA4b ORF-3-like protein
MAEIANVARVRVEIDDVAPRVMRRLEVPLSIRLDDLHFALQIAIGWHAGHPFEFRIGDKAWGSVDRDLTETSPVAAAHATLADLAAVGQSIEYNYLFGEDWQHTVEIESVSPAPTADWKLTLLSAEGRCPPEDIGGASGYEMYLKAIADPREPNHETMREWGDPDFDPNIVDIANLRYNLENLSKYLGRRKPPTSTQ